MRSFKYYMLNHYRENTFRNNYEDNRNIKIETGKMIIIIFTGDRNWIANDRKKSLKISKAVIRIRKSKEDKQHNGQHKKDKRTNNDLQNIHIKLKIE